ncbi:class I SAM-dependent methyltransferase [Bradyrhizobium sp.]|uniref:class I SAM-dependent methyltransferase n=1 Tax=Bradyrhizobium sp. TaxID=376 RepID=UPI003C776C2C
MPIVPNSFSSGDEPFAPNAAPRNNMPRLTSGRSSCQTVELHPPEASIEEREMTDDGVAKHDLNDASIYDNAEYLANNPSWHVEDSPWKAARIFEILDRNSIKPARIVEVGCGAGEILVQLKTKLPGSTFVGYEMSSQAFKLASERERPGVQFVNKSIFHDNVHFDALLCIDVFEHVDDYIGFVRSLKKFAKYKVFHIPLDLSVQSVFRSQALLDARKSVGHLHYFTKQTAIETVRYAGYEIIDHHLTAMAMELPNRGLRANLMNVPRWLLSRLSPDLAARLLGGWSLMVLAR